jgi:outer membrane protein TolC
MRFSVVYFLCLSASMASAQAQDFLAVVTKAVANHPSFPNYQAMVASAQSLSSIEKARRMPKVDGVLARVDGKQTLVETQSAWQVGLSASYPLYDAGKQNARDLMAKGDTDREMAVGLNWVESAAQELGATYLKLWETDQSLAEMKKTQLTLERFGELLEGKGNQGEVSPLTKSKVARKRIELANKMIEIRGKKLAASLVWENTKQPNPTQWSLPHAIETVAAGESAALMRSKAEVFKARAEVDFVKSDESLSVNLGASFLQRKYQNISAFQSALSWQINMVYPFYDGGLASSRSQRQVLVLGQKQAEFDALSNQTVLDLNRIRQDLAQSEILEKELRNLCELQANLAAQTQKRFDLGRGEALDVVEADLSLMDCRLQNNRQMFDIYSKRNDYLKFSGAYAQAIKGIGN